MQKMVTLTMGGASLAIGTALLLVAASFFNADRERAAKGGRAEGSVTEIEYFRGGNGKPMYRPHVRFTDSTGKTREFVSRLGSNPPGYAMGDRVAVIYDPARPASAEIDSFLSRHLGTLMFGLFGTVFAMLGAAVLVRAAR